ncbi:MAG: CDP-alcohol phosphatidyltransferase family protein [Saprospiraceae bacterium]|uniref:CDP-alcohol phosphatidyltransferase family protein n=1 Tax=Candidatus Opimibacter skivensis TaxID=2982028 RepID=A0A9D7XPL2_9BACT|nr:CDP-alcohol phosphatidyltransferase family protein [Candidatus Opimibacter skivensis]
MKLLNHLPNALTLSNLTFGTLAIMALMNGQIPVALMLVGGALVADLLDGAVARKLGVNSDLGIQLDSLADVISFGALPAVMIYVAYTEYGHGQEKGLIAVFASLSAASAGLRLARFNVDTRPREYFWGLATPAGGIMVTGWFWAQYAGRDYGLGMADSPWLGILIPVFLMIAFQVPLKLPGMKSPRPGIITAIVLVVLGLIGFVTLGPISIPLTIVAYVALGLLNLLLKWY